MINDNHRCHVSFEEMSTPDAEENGACSVIHSDVAFSVEMDASQPSTIATDWLALSVECTNVDST